MTNTDFTPSPPSDGLQSERTPKDMARDAVQAVKGEAASFAEGAKEMAVERVEQGKETATKTLGDFANAIRKAGDELAQHDQSMAGQVVRKAADGLESLSRSVTDKRPEEMLDAVRGFARENPAAFIAGSVLVGLALGRFAKSSERRQENNDPMQGRLFAEEAGYARPTPAYPIPERADDTLADDTLTGDGLEDGAGLNRSASRPEL